MIREQESPATSSTSPFDALDVRQLRRKAESLLVELAKVQAQIGKADDRMRRAFKRWEKLLLVGRRIDRQRNKVLAAIEARKGVKA